MSDKINDYESKSEFRIPFQMSQYLLQFRNQQSKNKPHVPIFIPVNLFLYVRSTIFNPPFLFLQF